MRWIDELWNGDFDVAEEIIDPQLTMHREGNVVDLGIAGVKQMVRQGRAYFDPIEFRAVVGPIAEGDLVSARWRATGVYAGGMEEASAEPGTEVEFHGNDFLRVDHGRFIEYWISSDAEDLLEQLKAH